MKLKALFPCVAIIIWLMPRTEAQHTNEIAGTVVSWGSFVIPQVAPGARYTKIAAGGAHSLALKSDGTVTAWGNGAELQSSVPGGLSNVVAIAAGSFRSLALKSNGTVVAWGDQDGVRPPPAVPAIVNGIVSIAAANYYNLAL